jgi:glycosyltransferase involved in cell wall biosynthesis
VARRRPRRRVVAALFFFPRGGSAFVARSLCRALPAAGWDATLVSGSLGRRGDPGCAATFFRGIDVRPFRYRVGPEPLSPPSYETAAELAFPAVDDVAYERLVAAWGGALDAAGAATAGVLHLHHLTPVHEAALRFFPDVPVVSHLHGTELAMLRAIETAPPPTWRYAARWRQRLRRWARSSAALVCLPATAEDAAVLLGVRRGWLESLPNGVDPELFGRRPLSGASRLAFWRRWLVEDPRGWDESGVPGTVAYDEADLTPFREADAVLISVGRFLAVKRIDLLIRAQRQAQERFPRPAPLVLVGGYPGEWEGPHPLAVIRETGARDVFLAGWRPHRKMPAAFNAADVLVFPSAGDSFGLPLVEAAACGVPAIAAAAGGPADIVRDGETGWLVPPDDEAALTRAIVEAVANPRERRRRGERARADSAGLFAWTAIAARLGSLFDEVCGSQAAAAERRAGAQPS